MATEPGLRAELAARARDARQVYCWQAQEVRLQEFYARVLSPPS